MESPLVSIIVPCYNQAQFLPEALDSVLDQTYTNWECIIVNDGSADNTEVVAERYCTKDQRFIYLSKENGGLSAARNDGIKTSKGKFILPLDSDDRIGNTYLAEAVTILEANKRIKLVYCKAELFGEVVGPWILPNYNYANLLLENMIFCAALYRKSDYDLTSGYNPIMKHGWEDWDFWLSLLKPSDEVYCIEKVLFYYRKKTDSMLKALTDQKMIEMQEQLFYNHLDKYIRTLGTPIGAYMETNKLKDRIRYLEEELKRKDHVYSSFKKSLSFKIGRIVTAPFRIFKSYLGFK